MEKFDQSYIEMAGVWARNSYCKRRQVGALIVKDRMIISDGYNGTPSGFENICEDENGVTKPYVLHAEANAISKVAQSGNSSKDATTANASIVQSMPTFTRLKFHPNFLQRAKHSPSADNGTISAFT